MGDWLKKTVKKISEKGGIFTFIRAQFSSQVSSLTDFTIALLLVNVFNVDYKIATTIGPACGGVVNSIINYKWTFKASGQKKQYVAIKYILVWLGSWFFNSSGTIFLTKVLQNVEALDVLGDNLFVLPKIVVSLLVGFIWNFNMQRLFVYRNVDIKHIFKKKNTTNRS